MTKPEKKEDKKSTVDEEKDSSSKKESVEDKLKTIEEKLLRTMAEMENQRRRFEKERDEAFEFGGLILLGNLYLF